MCSNRNIRPNSQQNRLSEYEDITQDSTRVIKTLVEGKSP